MFKKETTDQNLWMGLSFLVLGVMVGIFISGKGYSSLVSSPEQNGQLTPEEMAERLDPSQLPVVEVSVDDDAILGSSAAPITIVEFSDYQCPFCADFHNQTFKNLKKDYIDTGLVRFIYRDYPLDSKHPQAKPAAMAAECTRKYTTGNKDEAYFKMHSWLFENQRLWSGKADANDQFIAAAKTMGAEIQTCLEKQETLIEVESDFASGKNYGVQSTPVFFINGKKLEGAWPELVFKKVIEASR